eukprot:scaffold45710_cov27-Tisochrysis_lutea.AAC.2
MPSLSINASACCNRVPVLSSPACRLHSARASTIGRLSSTPRAPHALCTLSARVMGAVGV